ncbi:short transient receptor potential channel 6 [Biomphalaria glabrata]|nr:short transient receptor potential channel 6 [Biomphalaria glabrata]
MVENTKTYNRDLTNVLRAVRIQIRDLRNNKISVGHLLVFTEGKIRIMFIQRVQKTSRRAVSSRQYNVPQLSTDSSNRVYANLEDEFLHAAESGDVHTITRIMKAHPEMDTECIDALGRSPLRLAVKNEHLEVVQVLLEKSSQQHMYEAALLAISAGHIQIAETILKHKKYLDMCRGKKKLGATDDFYKTAFPDSQFSPDITPLILASQKNQYEIVQLLLLRGETIMKPHKFSCACQECQKKIEIDQLRLAKYRLNAYRGLASEAYISLSSKDPISTAFELAAELRRFSSIEKHFKCEYIDLADQLSDYVVKLLDRIRTQKELELVLNKRGKPDQEKFSSLARFKLALKYKEKKFVAHPSCQQRVSKAWRYGMGKFERANWPKRVLIILAIVLMYPALVCLHIAESKRKEAKILQLPVVKFTCYSMSFLIFLLLICISSWEASVRVSKHRTFLKSFTPNATNRYKECRQSKQFNKLLGKDFPLRDGSPSLTDLLLTFWIIGMVSQECNQLYQTGLDEHISLYNIMDFLLLSAYIAALTLRFLLMIKFNLAVEVLKEKYADPCTMIKSVYWLNTDRSLWDPWDPRNVSEGLFAFANIMSFYRLLYFLPAFEVLGPLQISLRRMLKDIAKFALLFMLIIFAFLVGMHNLYWYFGERAPPPRTATNPAYEPRAVKSFNDLTSTLHTIFWALFGRGEYKAVELNDYTLSTDRFGYIIYGTYHIICVTILINMLIAMMTRSFTRTAVRVTLNSSRFNLSET